jgi:hypothetical protein
MGVAPVTETDGYEGTLLDPNWPEVRLKLKQERPLWFYEDEWQVYLIQVSDGYAGRTIVEQDC